MINHHIDAIERIRQTNNTLWMDILRIALEVAPKRTRTLLYAINENDKRISEHLKAIAG